MLPRPTTRTECRLAKPRSARLVIGTLARSRGLRDGGHEPGWAWHCPLRPHRRSTLISVALAIVHQLDHVAIAVTDLDRSRRWYEDVLGLQRRYEDAWPDLPVVLCAGEACIALFPYGGSGPIDPRQGGFRHIAFRTDRTGFEAARQEFERHRLDLRFEDHGICQSLYLEDPDGYQVEVTTYDLSSE